MMDWHSDSLVVRVLGRGVDREQESRIFRSGALVGRDLVVPKQTAGLGCVQWMSWINMLFELFAEK